jgi:hypothetical protein
MCSECVYAVWWDEWRVFCTAEGVVGLHIYGEREECQ